MKKFLLFSILFYSFSLTNAKVVYLDNTKEENASQNLYSNFTDAYAACTTPGDTIYVIGSNQYYGNMTISKQITVIGPGYFLSENMATHVNKKIAVFGDITFEDGSEGSILKGVSNSYNINSEMYILTGNITVESCYIRDFIGIYRGDDANISNVIITKCYFANTSSSNINRYSINYDGIWLNFTITNNICNTGIYAPPGSTGIISNNLFKTYFNVGETSSFEIHNNILLASTPTNISLPPIPDASISYNLSAIDIFGTDNNNQSFINDNYLFVGNTDYSTDGQYQLAENSPASGAGIGGIDAGPYGGSDPYRPSGLPDLPNIYELSTGGFVAGDELNVHIKAKQ